MLQFSSFVATAQVCSDDKSKNAQTNLTVLLRYLNFLISEVKV